MFENGTWASLVLFLVHLVLVEASSGDATKYEIFIFGKIETRRSNLSCFHCFNGDKTDCMGMSDLQRIPTRTCLITEPYCKVRRFSIDGHLTTFDRYCAEQCTPGCQEGGIYSECVTCCNHRSFCNVGNSAHSLTHHSLNQLPAHAQRLVIVSMLGAVLSKMNT